MISQLWSMIAEQSQRALAFDSLVGTLHPRSVDNLYSILNDLVQADVLHYYLQLESPTTHVYLDRFTSLADIPMTYHDWSADKDIAVTPANLRPMFEIPGK